MLQNVVKRCWYKLYYELKIMQHTADIIFPT